MFLYRDKEINLLNDDYLRPNSTLNFIFGRRKVGKTTLINNYIKTKNALYLTSFETMSHILLESFKKVSDSFFNIENSNEILTLEDFIIYLSNQKIDNKIVIILENIQDYLKIDKEFIPKFYKYWNKYLKNKNIQFILTSSFYSSVKDDISIFNKADNILKLESISFDILKDRFKEKTEEELIDIYSVFGTTPEYIKYYNPNLNLDENIKSNFFTYNSFLFNEGMSIVKNDLSDAVTYCSILYSISLGNKKIGDIANFLNLKSSYITRYLQKLVDLMILKKSIPINDNPSKSKFGRYEFEDNFFKFWFCYVFPNQNYICNEKNDLLLVNIKSDFSNRHILDCYKKYLLEKFILNEDEYIGFSPIKIGSWWNNKDVEIDFIAYNSKEILFIDAKMEKNKESIDIQNLKAQSSIFSTPLEKKYMIIYKNDNFLIKE